MQTAGAYMHRHGCFPPSLSPSETAPARIPSSDGEFGQHLFFDEPFLGDFDAGFYSAIEQSCCDSTAGLNIDGTYSLASVNATFFEPLPFPSVVTNVAQPPQLLLQPTPTTGAFMAWDADNGPSFSESASTILKTELVSEPPAVSDTESVRHASPVSEPVSADQTSSPEADDDANGDADMDCVRDGSPGESSSDAAATTPTADGADIKHVCAASAGHITCSTSPKPTKRSRRSSDCASTRSLRNSSTSQQPVPLRNLRPSSTAKHSGGGSSSSSSSGSDREEAQTKRPYMRKLTVADLERHYELPLADASRALGLSATMLKKVCRSFGIRRWPHRQLASIDKMIARTDERIAGHAADLAQIAGAGDLVEEATRKMLASLRAQLAFLRDKKGAIRRATSRGLHVRALRQADLPDGDDAALHDAGLRASAAGADADVDRVPPLAATPPALVPAPAPPLGDGFDSVASATAQLLHMQQQLLQLQQQHNDSCQAQPAGQACQHGQLQDLQKQLLHLLQQRIAVDTMRAQSGAAAAAAAASGATLLAPSPAINAQQQQAPPPPLPLPPSAPRFVRAARGVRRAPARADGGSESCIPALDDLEDDFEDSDMAHYL